MDRYALPLIGCWIVAVATATAEPNWRSETLPVELQVGYAVCTLELSGDGKLDIAIVDSKRFVWLESPDWQLHVMHAEPNAPHDNVCFAPHDIDGDGDTDFAVGRDWQFNNTDTGGQIGWLRSPSNPRQPWEFLPIAEEPTTHRMQWMNWGGRNQHSLIVAPLKGRASRPPGFDNTAVQLLRFAPPATGQGEWERSVIDQSLHVVHGIDIVDVDNDQRDDLLAASFEGVTWIQPTPDGARAVRIASGQVGEAPAIGSSEVCLGRLETSERFLATIEPWHGDKFVVYTEPQAGDALWTRHVLDDQLRWGHAVACANLDDDPDEEVVIGVRDDASAQHRSGVRIYDPLNPSQGEWQRSLLAPGEVAVEDLTVADLDQDGDVDIVAVGRATHNAVIYWNEGSDSR